MLKAILVNVGIKATIIKFKYCATKEKVDGMDAVQLVKDTDFQAAVKYIVSRGCSVVYMGEDFLNISC